MRHVSLCMLVVSLSFNVHAQKAPAAPPAADERPTLPPRAATHENALQRQLPESQQLQLGEGESTFLGLFLPAARPEPLGNLLLIADIGEHANWPELIEPARQQLSEAGWNTLAIGLPDPPPPHFGPADEASLAQREQFSEQIAARLQQSLNALNEQGNGPTAILARGRAGYWTLRHAAHMPQVNALTLYQLKADDDADPAIPSLLEAWDKPLLDLAVKGVQGRNEAARDRQLIARRLARDDYRQILVTNPGNAIQTQDMLIKRISGWLRTLPGVSETRGADVPARTPPG